MASQPEQSEPELMDRVAAGDPVAFRLLADRHINSLLALANRMLDDRTEAEDVVQECFLRLWRDAGNWRARAAVGTWLYRIAYNLCIDRIRSRRPSVTIDSVDLPDERQSLDRQLNESDVARRLRAALHQLPERQRNAIILVHLQELAGKEAASVMNVSTKTLESLLARGRRNLRSRLQHDAVELLQDTP